MNFLSFSFPLLFGFLSFRPLVFLLPVFADSSVISTFSFCVAIMIRSSNRHELLCSRGNLAWSLGFRCTSLDQSVAARCRPPPLFAFQHVLQLFQTGLANWRILVVVILACSHSPQPHVQLRPKRTSASVLSCSTGLIRALAVGAQAFGLHSILHVCPRHRTQAFHSPFPLLFTGGDLV